jgi:prolyl oligopeptidase
MSAAENDPFLWLEAITDDEALDWVRKHNEVTFTELGGTRFEHMRSDMLEMLNTDDRIPYPRRRGEYLYDFWRGAGHPRGLWQRTTLEEYRKNSPEWEVIIDVDALAAAENENWVWASADVIEPEYTRALIELSRGGGDATVVREFDMTTKQFIADGFTLPEAKTEIGWEDEDSVLVATDFGEGSLTDSGYPRLVKRWRRGTPLDDAETIYEGQAGDVVVGAGVDRTPGFVRTFVQRLVDGNNQEFYELRDGELIRIDIPTDTNLMVHREWLLIMPHSDWVRSGVTYPAGVVIAADYEEFLAGTAELRVIFQPDAHRVAHVAAWTRDRLVLVSLADVATRVEIATPGDWTFEPARDVPDNATTGVAAIDPLGDEIFLNSSGFDKPARLLHGVAGGELREIKSAPAFFDADDIVVTQHFTESADGTAIPYFLVAHRDSPGPCPTLLGGYGGFGSINAPGYSGGLGRLWLSRGYNYAVANTRGGGEYGPAWHLQATRTGRHKVSEDFAAVAEDLVERGVTTARELGAVGASSGGLLMGIMLTQYPELFGALVCRMPLLDMRRYHLLLAGASWIAEYGDPDDPAEWEFIKDVSPYQNISADRRFPPVLMMTSTRDDRVHPGHARKMTAALEEAGHRVLFYENTEGGHGGVADHAQAAVSNALVFEFLLQTIGRNQESSP